MKRKVVVIGAVALAAAAGGAAFAASRSGTPQQESQAVIDDAARQLGITPAKLSDALEKALENRVDAAVAAGTITKAQGDELKARIASGDFPLIPAGFGHHGIGGHGFGHLSAAAAYLGLSESELQTQLASGKTLADVAKAQGKSVDGLVSALLADEKKELDAAVAAGRLTQAQADELLASAEQRITAMVNGTMPGPGRHGERVHGWHGGMPGMGRFDGSPSTASYSVPVI
ncbi:MAG: hypothetical protein ACM3QU_06340 [Verrucomicrobiota bacterium]